MDNIFSKLRDFPSFERFVNDIRASDLPSDVLIASCRDSAGVFPEPTFLYRICRTASVAQAKWLLTHDYFGLLWSDSDGKTALMYAAEKADVQSVSVMIQAEYDITATDRNGNNALLHLSKSPGLNRENRLRCISILLRAGISANSCSTMKETALMLSIYYGTEAESLMLLDYGADPDIPNGYGETPLEAAKRVVSGRPELIARLQSHQVSSP